MRVLGLHFGHDAGVALIEDGQIRFLAHSERLLRRKKPSGLSHEMVTSALARAGISPRQIDFCAIASTQAVDIVLDDRAPFDIEFTRHPADKIPSTLESAAGVSSSESKLRKILHPTSVHANAAARMKKFTDLVIRDLAIPEQQARILPTLNRGVLDKASPISQQLPLRRLSGGLPSAIDAYEARRFDFNFPATLVLDGQRIPAALISHHAAHAAATFYQSPYDSAPIMTLDGGSGFIEGGLFWLGRGRDILPLRVHYLELGRIYLNVAHYILKLGGSAEGKMMGLAPYGTPAFFDPRFVANAYDPEAGKDLAVTWIDHIRDAVAQSPHYVAGDIAAPDKMTTPINADIAASTQKLFEETMLVAVGELEKILKNIGQPSDTLALSGGCMLNCPTNTRISQETSFKNVYVEPACDDGGLPAGAALWVYHNLMGHSRTPVDPVKAGVPYLGLPLKQSEFDEALTKFADRIVVTRLDDAPAEGAKRLVAGQVIGWFEGRSEIGPRALGHRSIVADPRGMDTWQRVNTIKGRELWRPLAPSVLEEYAHEWFAGLPARSPFMMFVGEVIKPDVPAIRHIDGTARVQTVSPECGGYYKLIKNFHALTGCAVVLNTSMNGPGEPIAEYPADAIAMLLDGRFDALFLEGMLIERKQS